LIKAHNASGAKPELSAENIYVLEKGRELGAHQLSGAIMNPKALAELVPDFEKSAPLDTPVTDSPLSSSRKNPPSDFPHAASVPEPGQLRRLAQQARQMARRKVEAAGVNVFKEFGGAQLIYDRDGIGGRHHGRQRRRQKRQTRRTTSSRYELKAKSHRPRRGHARLAHQRARRKKNSTHC